MTIINRLRHTSYNTGYTAHSVRPNSAKGGTSYSPKPLSAIPPKIIRYPYIIVNDVECQGLEN